MIRSSPCWPTLECSLHCPVASSLDAIRQLQSWASGRGLQARIQRLLLLSPSAPASACRKKWSSLIAAGNQGTSSLPSPRRHLAWVWIGPNVRALDGLPTPATSSTTKQLIRFVVQPRSQAQTTRKPLAERFMPDGNDNSLVSCTLRLAPKPVQSDHPGIPRVSATWRTTQTNLACSERRHAGGSVPMGPREKQTPGNRLTNKTKTWAMAFFRSRSV